MRPFWVVEPGMLDGIGRRWLEMIDRLVEEIPDALLGFNLYFSYFSASPFPGIQQKVTWVREETGGH